MIRDRGRIKWTSMMLPEHVKMLREWVQEDEYEQEKVLDEQQLEQMNETILGAMEFNYQVAITHYRQHKYEIVVGRICYWDALVNKLHIMDRFESLHRIALSDVVDVCKVEE
ncbi:YolD-like family protein [Mesobacillus maritimus]|uniref:YolD-like family protein n=1 Tax=Mesobacillus maritimus TaxID=1643336 RepID=UPI00203B8CFF|nr:YolD-like family protein [Mesobacillus maritimus]MCM3586424.1 YolD-like family protein [Mesobacillus maritimus]MCM3669544.1 YolD-like family protein [Mesobacillus maritimus]